ncbi:MAG: hypothetical protein JNK78_00630 [Planctomycetes bacterium]|nr:hypothetical protein [Planctomycetota bacterium]
MDANAGVERQPQVPIPRNIPPKKSPSDGGVAVVDAATRGASAARPRDGNVRVSPDPMRATDRYRLVMPYSAPV